MNISVSREYKDEYGEYITEKLSECTIDFNNLLLLVAHIVHNIRCTILIVVSKKHHYGVQINVHSKETDLYVECSKEESDRLNRFLYNNCHRSPLFTDFKVLKRPHKIHQYDFLNS